MNGFRWSRLLRLALAWLVGLYLARMYVQQGWIKFDDGAFWARAFERWGYPPWLRVTVGAIEVIGGVMLVIPWLATYGAIAVAGVMGGALVTRTLDGRYVDVAWIALYMVGLLWIAYEWRDWLAKDVPDRLFAHRSPADCGQGHPVDGGRREL